jgi:hypothetical protein
MRTPPTLVQARLALAGSRPGPPQILSSYRTHTTIQYRDTLILRGSARLVVQTGSVAPYPRLGHLRAERAS